MSARPRILLTNDDGVRAPGLRAAYEALSEIGDVTVVAPTTHMSGASHKLTLDTPLRAVPLEEYPGYRVDFTPVDCVKLALKHLLPERPDLVVSGINRGHNAGYLVHYSGTVAAAKEATLSGIPAMAISLAQHKDPDFQASGQVAQQIAPRLLEHPLPIGVVLNVNVPRGSFHELKGARWCRQSMCPLSDVYERRIDPRRQPYYWLLGTGEFRGLDPQDDLSLIHEGYVTLTPLTLDWTHDPTFQAGAEALVSGLEQGLQA